MGTSRYMLQYTLKYAGLFQSKFGSNTDKHKCWVKNVIKKLQLKVKVEVWGSNLK